MAAAPDGIPLYSDFAGGASSPFPSGWEAGLFSGESGWQLDGSGAAQPSAASWRCMASTVGFDRGATPGGIIIEWSVLPDTGKVNLMYLVNDKTLDSPDGYAFRWQPGTGFQVQRWTAGAETFLDGSSTVTGTIAAGFLMALMVDDTTVSGYVSTDGGANWQLMGTATDTNHMGTLYGAQESDATSTAIPKITNVWLGLNDVLAPPTIVARNIWQAESGTTVEPPLGAHVADQTLIAQAMIPAASNLAISAGWTPIGVENNANLSTGWWRKLAASGAEADPVITSSVAATPSAPLTARTYVVDGATVSDPPFEDATFSGPTLSTTPAGSTVDTTGDKRLVVTLASIDSATPWATPPPPATWIKVP